MSAQVGMRMWRCGRWVLRRALVYFPLDEIIFSERGSRCLVGVDIGVEVEPNANGDGVDEPALTGADKMVTDQEDRRRARSQGKR